MSWLLPPLEPHFEAALRDVHARTTEARTAAAKRLGKPEQGRQLDAERGLLMLLEDPQTVVRGAALRSLRDIGSEATHGPVLARIEDPDPLIRELAVIALANIEHPHRASALLQALARPEPEVRFQALGACAELCPEDAIAEILTATRDPDVSIREAATRALGCVRAEDGRVNSRLRALLEDSKPGVRLEAALVLAKAAEPAAVPHLTAALAGPTTRLDALDGLSHYTLAEARAAVYTLGRRVLISPLYNAAAGRALLLMGDRNRAIECLRDALVALRREGRNLALETIRDFRVSELAGEVRRLERRARGADPALVVETATRIAAPATCEAGPPDRTPAAKGRQDPP